MSGLANPNHNAAPFADRPHVLIVDDDERIRSLVSRFLTEQGFVAMTAANAAEANELLRAFLFDVLVVDVMMPGQTGTDFTRDLRKSQDIPVLLLTALGETENRIEGLESGADDYLPKPFEPRELVLRLHAILRRRPATQAVTTLRLGKWIFDRQFGELRDGATALRLTQAETTLLAALGGRPGDTLSRDELAKLCGAEGRTIDVQVTRLRRKLEDNPKAPRILQTVRGRGYRLMATDA